MPHPNSAASAASRSWRAVAAALLLLLPIVAQAQLPAPKVDPDLLIVPEAEALRQDSVVSNPARLIWFFDHAPTFRGGGIPELTAYIQRQLRWPAETPDLPPGRLFASFVVDAAGQVRDAKIAKGLHPLVDAEVLRVVRALTDFTPAKLNGKPVSVGLTIPVEFKIR